MMNNLLGVYTYTIKSRIPLKGPISNPEAFAFNIDTFYIQFIFSAIKEQALPFDRSLWKNKSFESFSDLEITRFEKKTAFFKIIFFILITTIIKYDVLKS